MEAEEKRLPQGGTALTRERDFDPALNMFLIIVIAVILSWAVTAWIINILRAIAHVG